jgi:hypothetical protein
VNATVFYKSFSRLPLQARLGNLAVTINRLADCLEKHQNQEGAKGFVRESMWFIEWTASELEFEHTEALVKIQRTMGNWFRQWESIWNDKNQSLEVQHQARAVSKKLFSWIQMDI